MSTIEPQCDEAPPTLDVKFEYWRSSLNRLWYWHLKTVDNEKLAQGEAYPTKGECLQAIARVRGSGGAMMQNLSTGEGELND